MTAPKVGDLKDCECGAEVEFRTITWRRPPLWVETSNPYSRPHTCPPLPSRTAPANPSQPAEAAHDQHPQKGLIP